MSRSPLVDTMPKTSPELSFPASVKGDEELDETTDFAAQEKAGKGNALEPQREIFYREVIELSEENGTIICESAGRDGYYFTLISDTDNRYSDGDLGPNLFLKIPNDRLELILKSPMSVAHHVPGQVIQEFFETVFAHIPDDPRSMSLRAEVGILTSAQLDLIGQWGFTELKQGSLVYQPAEEAAQSLDKQTRLNDGLEEAKDLFAAYMRGEAFGEKPHNEWCRSGSMLLQLALIKEAEDGLEAAYDLLEATRLQFVNAEKSLPDETWETAELDLLAQIEYAGTLARLAACDGLRDYNRQQVNASVITNNRRQDLFDSAIRMYENAENRIPKDAPMELRFLVGSGKAHAYALHVKYGNIDPSDSPAPTGDTNPYLEKAVSELERLDDTTPPGIVSTKIQQQLSDTLTERLGYEPADGQAPIADVELRHLTEEVLAYA